MLVFGVPKRTVDATLELRAPLLEFVFPRKTWIAICQRDRRGLKVQRSQIVKVQWTKLVGSIDRLYLTDAIYLTIS